MDELVLPEAELVACVYHNKQVAAATTANQQLVAEDGTNLMVGWEDLAPAHQQIVLDEVEMLYDAIFEADDIEATNTENGEEDNGEEGEEEDDEEGEEEEDGEDGEDDDTTEGEGEEEKEITQDPQRGVNV